MKLYQISGKKLLQTFVHSAPVAATASEAASLSGSNGNGKQQQVGFMNGDIDGDSDDGNRAVEEDVILSVECVGFSQGDIKWVASGGMDKLLKIWDPVTGLCRISCKHGDSVVSLRWHSSLPVISTASLDRNIRVWDARNGALLVELTGHNDLVTNLDMVSLSPLQEAEEEIIATVSDDGTAKIFHVNCRQLILQAHEA